MAFPRQFWLLWTGTAVNRVGLLVPGFLALYLIQRKLTDVSGAGVMVGLFGAGLVAAGLVGGVLADRIGARCTIILAQAASAVSAIALMLSENVIVIGVGVLIAGCLSTINRPASAGLVVTLVAEEQWTRAYGLLYWAQNIGASAGPVLAGLLLAVFPQGIFLLWAATSVAYAALAWPLPAKAVETRPANAFGRSLGEVMRDIAAPFRVPIMAVFLVLSFLLACVYLQRQSTLPLGLTKAGLSTREIGLVIAVNPVLVVVLQPLISMYAERIKQFMPFVLAASLVGLGYGMNLFANSVTWFGVSIAVWTLGEILQSPFSAAFIADRAPSSRVSSFQGAYFFVWNLGLVVGGPAGVFIAQRFSFGTLWATAFILCVLVATGFFLMSRVNGYHLAPRRDHKPQNIDCSDLCTNLKARRN